MSGSFGDYFKGKKITLMGLGLLGRGTGDARFLAECGAELVVTDLKSAEELKESLELLSPYKNIVFALTAHRMEDFRGRDMIIKAAGVPFDSPYIACAEREGIPISMSTALFAKFTPATVVGITGTRGKSTVTHLLHQILQAAFPEKRIFLGGNVRGVATLPFLPHAREGDIAVLELDSWQLQGFGKEGISPRIAVFTTLFPDHLNYYKRSLDRYLADKANIFLYQKPDDTLILGSQAAPAVYEKYKETIRSKIIIPDPVLPGGYETKLLGEHNSYNASLAAAAARSLGATDDVMRRVVADFAGVPGRLELVRSLEGVRVYNDTTATTPDATIAALKALGKDITLIMGGADKGLDMTGLIDQIPAHCTSLILLPGTGTERIRDALAGLSGVQAVLVHNLGEAVEKALSLARPNGTILFSPAFASFGMFKNEFDRGDQFLDCVRKLK